MNTLQSSTLVLAVLLMAVLPAHAQSMRCKNDLANVGDSKASVLQKCGAPVLKDSFCKPADKTVAAAAAAEPGRTVVHVTPCETVDEWTYNPGRGQFMTTLRFESSRLISITYGERVQ